MARYIDGALIRDESVIYTGTLSLWSLAPMILIGIFITMIGVMLANATIAIGLAFFLVAFIRYKTTELAITNKRVIAKFGFISRTTIEINIQKIESIQVHQGILGRIFNFGSLVVSGAGNPQAPIPGISNPLNFRRVFMETQDIGTKTTTA